MSLKASRHWARAPGYSSCDARKKASRASFGRFLLRRLTPRSYSSTPLIEARQIETIAAATTTHAERRRMARGTSIC